MTWAALLARLRTAGTAMPIKDSLIAATALTHDLIVATQIVRTSRRRTSGSSIPSTAGSYHGASVPLQLPYWW